MIEVGKMKKRVTLAGGNAKQIEIKPSMYVKIVARYRGYGRRKDQRISDLFPDLLHQEVQSPVDFNCSLESRQPNSFNKSDVSDYSLVFAVPFSLLSRIARRRFES